MNGPMNIKSKNQSCRDRNGQIGEVLGCFKHGNKYSNYK